MNSSFDPSVLQLYLSLPLDHPCCYLPRTMAFRLEAGMAAAPSDATAGSQADGTYTLFFFGTLVHPAILSKIIQNDGSHLSVQPAILPGYVVHHIINEDYPALIAKEHSDVLMKTGQVMNGKAILVAEAVRGTVVRGLSAMDVLKLDLFEGDEYVRIGVKVRPDTSVLAMSNDKRPRDESIGQILSNLNAEKIAHLIATVPEEPANAYLWRASVKMLEPRIWDFADFASSGKDRKWYS
jgi:hypothetical protein